VLALSDTNLVNNISEIVVNKGCVTAIIFFVIFNIEFQLLSENYSDWLMSIDAELIDCFYVDNCCRCRLHSNSEHASGRAAERRRLFARVFPVCQTITEVRHYRPRFHQS